MSNNSIKAPSNGSAEVSPADLKPFAKVIHKPASELRPERVEQIRTAEHNRDVHVTFLDAYNDRGEQLPPPANRPVGAAVEQNAVTTIGDITYIGRGRWWATAIESIDGVEHVRFVTADPVPCTVHDWCHGHRLEWNEELESLHVSEAETLWEFDRHNMRAYRSAEGDAPAAFTVFFQSLDGPQTLDRLDDLASSLANDAATALSAFVARERLAKGSI